MSYLFGEQSFISVGDKYIQHKEKYSREKGKQFITNPTRQGQSGKGVYFSTYDYKSEKYLDPGTHERVYKKKKKEKLVNPQPFKYSSPTPKSSGSGSYFGTIGGRIEHVAPGKKEPKKKNKEDEPLQKRNIITNPPKKGTFGFPGTTLEKNMYKWDKPNPYDTYKEHLATQSKKGREKMMGKLPFKSSCKGPEFFSTNQEIYKVDDSVKKGEQKKTKKGGSPSKKNVVPFKIGAYKNATFNPYPKYVPTTTDEKKKKKKKEGEGQKEFKVFKPAGTTKSGPTRSIIFGSNRGLF